MRTPILIAATAAVASLVLAGCSTTGSTTGSSTGGNDGIVKVGFLAAAARNDGGFTQYGLAGVTAAVKADKNLKLTSIVDNVTSAQDQIQGLESLAVDNQIVIADSASLDKAVAVAAAKYPDTRFILVAANTADYFANVTSVSADVGLDAIVAGAVAANLSKTGKMGMISGLEVPASTAWYYGMKQGAEAQSPSADVAQAYTGDYNDVGKAQQAANAMIANGADMLLSDLDSGSQGVYQAAEAASSPVGVFQVFALVCDASPSVVGAGVISWASILQQSVANAANKKLPAGAVSYGPKSGALTFEFCPGKGDDASKAIADKVTKDIATGDLAPEKGVLLDRPSYKFTQE
jgi:basic membrane protein A